MSKMHFSPNSICMLNSQSIYLQQLQKLMSLVRNNGMFTSKTNTGSFLFDPNQLFRASKTLEDIFKEKNSKKDSPNDIITGVRKNGKWSLDEQKQYVEYIGQHYELMCIKSARKLHKIFMKMSKRIRTRNSDQCRSHHQKMLKYQGGLSQILKRYNPEYFAKEEMKAMSQVLIKKVEDTSENNDLYKMKIKDNKIKIIIDVSLIQSF